MKTLGRILIIVLAACAISGATYALAQTGLLPTSLAREGFEGRRPESSNAANVAPGQDAAGASQRPEGGADRRAGGAAGIAVVLRNFALMAVVILVGAIGVRLVQNRKHIKRSVAL